MVLICIVEARFWNIHVPACRNDESKELVRTCHIAIVTYKGGLDFIVAEMFVCVWMTSHVEHASWVA